MLKAKRVEFLTCCVVNREKEGEKDSPPEGSSEWEAGLDSFGNTLTWQVDLVPRGH